MQETIEKPVSDTVSIEEETLPQKSESTPETFYNSYVSFMKAAELVGKNRGQISKDTKLGKLPFRVSDDGRKQYKVSDLDAIYGLINPKKQNETGFYKKETDVSNDNETRLTEAKETGNIEIELAVAREHIRAQDELIKMKDDVIRMLENQIHDLRGNRDKLLDQTSKLTHMLPAPPETTEQPKPWWRFGR